jgi:hypothetical protein
MKYGFTKKLGIAILGILLITCLVYYVGDKIREYQEEQLRIKEAFSFNDIGKEIKGGFEKAGDDILEGLKKIIKPITDFITGVENVFKGMAFHFNCGSSTMEEGYKRGLKVLEIHFKCSIDKIKGLFDGSCTFYYLVDMYVGILRIIIITIPLFLLKNIFGVDLQFIVDLVNDVIIEPLDAITTSTMGFSITHWSEDVRRKCYLCSGDFGEGAGVQYKTFSKWSEYYKCTTGLINRGTKIMVDSIFDSKHSSNWYNGRNVDNWEDWNFKN